MHFSEYRRMHSGVSAFGVERLCIMFLNPIMQCGQETSVATRTLKCEARCKHEGSINGLRMEEDNNERSCEFRGVPLDYYCVSNGQMLIAKSQINTNTASQLTRTGRPPSHFPVQLFDLFLPQLHHHASFRVADCCIVVA